MALATPRGVPAPPRLLASPDTVEILVAPGDSVQARAHRSRELQAEADDERDPLLD
ncbi:MAG: hypothetical protein SGPRY_012921 [Prymnesium sp.]